MNGKVIICECFARDGLQHEPHFVATANKLRAIDAFSDAGFSRIEATSYSNPAKVPAFADASDVLKQIKRNKGASYKATCANLRAVERALADITAGHGANELSLLVSATSSHSERNLHATRERQWDNIVGMAAAVGHHAQLVGVISVAFGCPFEGKVDPGIVIADAQRFGSLGVRHVTIGDTAGFATPSAVRKLFGDLAIDAPDVVPIAHFHDTRGTGLANCMAALDAGCRYFDSSFGGVGGHPAKIVYGNGHTGNVATEELVNLFVSEGFETGLDLDAVMRASRLCETILGRELESKVARSGFGPVRQIGASC